MSHRSIDRHEIIQTLHSILEPESTVLAAWLGGSDASGRTDRYSDVDLQVIVPDDRVEQTFALIHEGLEALSPIELRYRFPEPTWHGHSQELLRLRDADPNHFLDLVVMKLSGRDRLLESERHGHPLVLFDRCNLLAPVALDRAAHRKKMEQRLADLRVQFPLLQPLVTRGILRGQPAESAYAYQVLTLKPLTELLRMRYCPERFDFGLRYIDRDLPADWRAEIERLAYPPSREELLGLHACAVSHFEKQMAAFDRGEWDVMPA
ncbi:MAG: nucleotidyltransferase domain-containing protein [Candidatus Eisenbacteria bacterium]